VTAQGAGRVDVGAARRRRGRGLAGTLALGRSTGPGWRVKASFTVTNLSTRTLRLSLAVRTQDEGAAAVDILVSPAGLRLAQGETVLVHLSAITASAPTGSVTADGTVVVAVRVGEESACRGDRVRSEQHRFDSGSDALLQVVRRVRHEAGAACGRCRARPHRQRAPPEVRPLSRLDVVLWRADGTQVGVSSPGCATYCRVVSPSAHGTRPRRAAPAARRLRRARRGYRWSPGYRAVGDCPFTLRPPGRSVYSPLGDGGRSTSRTFARTPFRDRTRAAPSRRVDVDIDQNLVNVLSRVQEGRRVSVPVGMDDGSDECVRGLPRHAHSARGPSKGGIRYHPDVHARRGQGAADVDDVEVRADGHPFGVRRAASSATPKKLSRAELDE